MVELVVHESPAVKPVVKPPGLAVAFAVSTSKLGLATVMLLAKPGRVIKSIFAPEGFESVQLPISIPTELTVQVPIAVVWPDGTVLAREAQVAELPLLIWLPPKLCLLYTSRCV